MPKGTAEFNSKGQPRALDGRRNNPGPPAYARIKKGEVRNPHGGHKKPEGMAAIQRLTQKELLDVMNLIVRGKATDVMKLLVDEEATALERMIGSIVTNIIVTGDSASFERLIGRMIGKVPETFNFNGRPPQVVITLPSNGRELPPKDLDA